MSNSMLCMEYLGYALESWRKKDKETLLSWNTDSDELRQDVGVKIQEGRGSAMVIDPANDQVQGSAVKNPSIDSPKR